MEGGVLIVQSFDGQEEGVLVIFHPDMAGVQLQKEFVVFVDSGEGVADSPDDVFDLIE